MIKGKYLDPKADLTFKKRVLLRSTSGRLLPTGRKNASKAYVAQTNKGMFYANLQTAMYLKSIGLSCHQIAQATGLNLDVIESL